MVDPKKPTDQMTISSPSELPKGFKSRSLISFWVFGLCNNFAYVVMLSAAQDILRKNDSPLPRVDNGTIVNEECVEHLTTRDCAPISTGVVLLCNILPSLFVKFTAPFYIHYFPYGVRHLLIVLSQMASLLMTAFSDGVLLALSGVAMASFSSGLGEITYLALASHYSPNTISTWSSGTGAAGIVGALSYAGLTDSKMIGLSPKQALISMLIVPIVFAITYYVLLIRPDSLHKSFIHKPSTWIERKNKNKLSDSSDSEVSSKNSGHLISTSEKFSIILNLCKYMVPLALVYFAQYLINQGIVELIIFDCATGLRTTPEAQYRWYQVLYQIGVFISRSSINLIQLPFAAIAMLPVIQLSIASSLLVNALSPFVPHILILCGIILCEGLVGGSAYVNTMHHIHKKVPSKIREFCLLVVSVSDTVGILVAALVSVPVHNSICTLPLFKWF